MARTSSRDGGATWSRPHLMFRTGEIGLHSLIRVGVTPVIAYDPKHRSLDAVWNDPYFNHGRYVGAIFTRSVDGIHWSAPIRIDSRAGKVASDPMVAAAADATVAVTYYQRRDSVSYTPSPNLCKWAEGVMRAPSSTLYSDSALAPRAGEPGR
jgi:hypothetical protein